MILVKIIEPKISTAVELWRKLQLKTKFFFRIIVGGESPWKHLPFIKSIWRLASPNALNRSNLMRVSALRLFSRWVFLSCIAERADMSTSASLCWSITWVGRVVTVVGEGVVGLAVRDLGYPRLQRSSLQHCSVRLLLTSEDRSVKQRTVMYVRADPVKTDVSHYVRLKRLLKFRLW